MLSLWTEHQQRLQAPPPPSSPPVNQTHFISKPEQKAGSSPHSIKSTQSPVCLIPKFVKCLRTAPVVEGKTSRQEGEPYLFIFVFFPITPIVFFIFFSSVDYVELNPWKLLGYCFFAESYGGVRWRGSLGAYQTDSTSDRSPEPSQ